MSNHWYSERYSRQFVSLPPLLPQTPPGKDKYYTGAAATAERELIEFCCCQSGCSPAGRATAAWERWGWFLLMEGEKRGNVQSGRWENRLQGETLARADHAMLVKVIYWVEGGVWRGGWGGIWRFLEAARSFVPFFPPCFKNFRGFFFKTGCVAPPPPPPSPPVMNTGRSVSSEPHSSFNQGSQTSNK